MSSDLNQRVRLIEQLEHAFEGELVTDKWAAAETAYALAILSREVSVDQTLKWLDVLLNLLREFPDHSLEQTATRRMKVGGILLPEFLHDGVVKARFEGLLRTI